MGLGPFHDRARPGYRPTLVEQENRDLDVPGELLHLVTATATLSPGPRCEAVPGHLLDLVLIAGVVKRAGRPPTGVTDAGVLVPLAAGVEDHGSSLSRRAITSGTCSR